MSKQYVNIQLSPDAVYSGNLLLVNARHPYRETAPPELVTVNKQDNVLLQKTAATLLNSLLQKIGAGSWQQIAAVSGWRSLPEQQQIYQNTLQNHGQAFTEQFVARPGCSEHQTGLAIDLGLRRAEIDFIRPHFPDHGIAHAFRRQATAFGFIQRYPADREQLTGIAHEPWHFRYVGVPHAAIMQEKQLILEEYVDFLHTCPWPNQPCTYQQIAVSYLPLEPTEKTCLQLPAGQLHLLSGNNVDGIIITQWPAL